MEDLSIKAKIIYAAFDLLNATRDNKVNVYQLLDFITESEELQKHELLKDVSEFDYTSIIMDINTKSINAVIVSLCRKEYLCKTEPSTIKIDGESRFLRQYFLKK